MLEAEEMRDLARRYTELMTAGEWEAIAELYSETGATMEDPVGSEAHTGRVAIAAVYRSAAGTGIKVELTGPVRVAANEMAFPLRATLPGADGATAEMDVIDVMVLDSDGKIRSMRAYWRPEDIRS